MGTLAVDNIQHTDGSSAVTLNNANITDLSAGTLSSGVTFPAGHVIQVHSFAETLSGGATHNSNAYSSSYAKSTSITPLSSTSKLLVQICSTCYLGSGTNSPNVIGKAALFEGTVSTIRQEMRIGSHTDTTGRDIFRIVNLQYVADSGTASVAQTFGMCVKNWSTSYDNHIGWSDEGGVNEITIVITEYN